jgi:hypothetical protein
LGNYQAMVTVIKDMEKIAQALNISSSPIYFQESACFYEEISCIGSFVRVTKII